MKTIKLPFGWKLYLFICDKEQLEKESKRIKVIFNFGNDNEEHKTEGFADFIKQESPKEDIFVIWINNKKEKNYSLIHEIYHIVYLYCNHLDIRDEEFKAYLITDICKQLKLLEDSQSD
jgi:Zn-dependent peptidase ImmA (M78 family)